MAKQLLLVAACTVLAAAAAANSTAATRRTAYDIMESYGFPRGILPTGVQRYSLHPNGSFEVILTRRCRSRMDRMYTLRYSSLVAGSIRLRSMSGLNGIELEVNRNVKARVIMGINKVDRYGDELRFQGFAGVKSFGIEKFSVSPSCV